VIEFFYGLQTKGFEDWCGFQFLGLQTYNLKRAKVCKPTIVLPLMDGTWLSVREFAEGVGVSDTAVHKAVKAGKIPKSCFDYTNIKRPKINKEAALLAWGKNWAPAYNQAPDLGKALAGAKDPKPEAPASSSTPAPVPKSKKPPKDPDQLELDPDDLDSSYIQINDDADFNEAKRVEAIGKAKLVQIELAERKGKLVDKSKVYKELYSIGQEIRSALQGIPDKHIDNILACDNRPEAHSLLYKAITEALEGFTKKLKS
jgi:hypothetical protein